uniref:AAA_23 domain-containing protein n=1 Tax=Parastrongyloides trichosuri TaxID=131310 RepID=A0A0N4ZFB9_PARTI
MVRFLGLKIQGVRSVGEKPHVISFLDPLTLIQGENGTGKTTLIESLNYVTTGALPSGKMQAFIHNNLLAQKQRVDASIQLNFIDLYGMECTITKRMSSSVKAGKASSKSDEITLTVKDKAGLEHSISSKVSDINREVLKHMGVSKAILENVIFCHQEDSCWPLGEPKELKTRFDAIFDVTKYVKAMDYLKKVAKDYESSLKLHDAHISHFVEDKTEYLKLRSEEEKYMSNKKELVQGISTTGEKYENLQSELEIVRDNLKVAECEEKGLTVMNTQKEMLERQLIDLKSFPYYEGSKDELMEEIKGLSVSEGMQSVELAKDATLEQIEDIDLQINNKECILDDLQASITNIEMNRKKHEDICNDKNLFESRVASKYEINDHNKKNILEYLKNLKVNSSKKGEDIKKENKMKINHLNDINNKNKFQQMFITKELSRSTDEREMYMEKINSCKKKYETFVRTKSELVDFSSELEKYETELKTIGDVSGYDQAEANRELLDTILKKLIEAKSLCNEKEAVSFEYDSILEMYMEDLKNILKENFIPGEFYENIRNVLKIIETDIGITQTNLSNEIGHINGLNMRIEGIDSLYKENKNKCIDYETRIRAFFPKEVDVTKEIEYVKKQIEIERKEINMLEASKFVFGNWLQEIENCSSCPLCENKFQSQNDVVKLQNKIVSQISNSPEKLESLKLSLLSNENKLEKLIGLGDVYPEFIRLSTVYLPQKKEERNKLNERRELFNTYRKEYELTLKNLTIQLEKVKKLEKVGLDLDRYYSSKLSTERNFKEIIEKILSFPMPFSLSFISNQQEINGDNINNSIEFIKSELKASEYLINTLKLKMERKSFLNQKIHTLKDNKIQHYEKMQKIDNLKNEIQSFEKEVEELDNKIIFFKNSLSEIEIDLKKSEEELCNEEKEISNKNEEVDRYLNDLNRDIEDLENLYSKIEQLESEFSFDSLYDLNNEKFRIKDDIENLKLLKDTQKDKLSMLNNIKETLHMKQSQLRRLEVEEELTKLLRDINEKKYDGKSKVELLFKERKIVNEIALTSQKLTSMKTELAGVEKRLKELKISINTPKYCNASNNLQKELIRKVVTKKAITDLDLYRKVLDKSIIKFHQEKMEEINASLSELWKKVYKGNDIETIRINSRTIDEVKDKRKSYDYSVTMVIDGTEIEMRDRCSAGQKMLASILIRVALCEVFCSQCPILALDEPTTNLDSNKVENIAEMLSDLILYRMNGLPSKPIDDCCVEERMDLEESHQKSSRVQKNFSNFQLIVITHDHELTHLLYRNFKPEYVYQLKKDEMGDSKIIMHKSIE